MKHVVSEVLLIIMIVGMLEFAFKIQPVRAGGTIYIRANGLVEGTDKIVTSDNITYIFIGNITDSIVVERSNIKIDGDGYTLQGTGSGNGVDLSGRENVTVRNTQIKAFYIGIWLNYSFNCIISKNNIATNQKGIVLFNSSSNNISHNRVETNTDYGISLYHSDRNNLSSNVVSNNDLGFWVESGINNNISRNSVKANFDYGIKFVDTSSKNTIFENEIMNQPCGIDLYRTNFNKVSANNITGNSQYGILLEREDCFDNTISENNIVDNYYGISDYSSNNNIMYHNNFLNNTIQADIHYSVNVWDNGYPSGGNYWSDYTGFDNRSGLNQDKPRSDGICDSPYVINENNTDKYPLMKPWKSVTMIGDVNHDGIVDILDIVHISSIYHCQEGELDWNPEADLAPPYGIIDMLDLVTCVFHYGEKWK